MLKKKLVNLFFLLIIFLAGVLVGIGTKQSGIDFKPDENVQIDEEANKEEKITVSLMIDYGNRTVKTFKPVELDEEKNVFGLLKKVSQNNNFELEYDPSKNDMGVFVKGIDGINNDNQESKWWTYWVNNESPMLAADQFKLNDGDVVEWKYGINLNF
jgi:preprotein translocase subunit SecF